MRKREIRFLSRVALEKKRLTKEWERIMISYTQCVPDSEKYVHCFPLIPCDCKFVLRPKITKEASKLQEIDHVYEIKTETKRNDFTKPDRRGLKRGERLADWVWHSSVVTQNREKKNACCRCHKLKLQVQLLLHLLLAIVALHCYCCFWFVAVFVVPLCFRNCCSD